ncbi:MAG: right-handed parallel beta-helix repeat-containing protein, partial [Thermoplasmata archaeon]
MELKSETTRSIRLRNGRNNNHCFTKGLKNGFAYTNARKTGRKLKESMCHRNIQALFVLAILVLNIGAVHTWQHMGCKHLNPKTGLGTTSKEMEVKGIPHAPIHINGNSEFTSTNGVTGGSGTENDPYIIEGWDIDGNGGSYCIWIENTTAYFVIKNCHVWNATDARSEPYGTGIALRNVTNGIIETNECNNCRGGIELYKYSSNNTIANNNASDNKYGISLLFWCSSNIIINNGASRNSVNGITLTFSSNNSITNNNASHNSANGIRLESSSNNTI